MAMDSMTESAEQGAAGPARGRPTSPVDLETVLMGAVDEARAAIVEFSGEDTVGEYLGASFEDPTAATHRFLADMPGYRGWQWAVVVAGVPRRRSRHHQRGGAGSRARRRCWRRSGCRGRSGSSPAT